MSNLKELFATYKTFDKGFKIFKATGETPHEAYVAMRKLFVETNGWFNDVFQFFYGMNKTCGPNRPVETSVLAGFSQTDVTNAVKDLETVGYHVFSKRIPEKILDQLLDFSLKTPALLQYDNSQSSDKNKNLGMGYFQLGHVVDATNICFDPKKIEATNYRLPPESVLNCTEVQEIMSDPAIINVAQQYIKSQVMFSLLGMWWTTPFGCDTPSSALAQQYHFDMDRIKFLNFFIYLTDVETGDGPHCYVKNSCKRKPKALRRDGRFSDIEIENNYDKHDIVRVLAPRGTIIVGDTRAFHKAEMPKTGNRLVLNFELATCMIGASYPKAKLEVKNQKLATALKENPFLWSNFELQKRSLVEAK